MDEFLAGDPLRAAAALWVVIFHCANVTLGISGRIGLFQQSFGRWPGAVFGSGGAGLDIFFVLSGYLISRPFVSAVADGTPRPRLPRYAAARVLRIYPAFWCVVAVTLVIYGTMRIGTVQLIQFVTLRHVDRSIPFEAVLAPAWSLPLELGFYVLVPVAALCLLLLQRTPRLPKPGRKAIIGLAIGTWVAAALWTALANDTSTILFATLGFAPGVLLAATETRAPSWLTTLGAGRWWLGLAGASGAALLVHIDYVHALGRWQTLPPPLLAAGLVSGLLMYQRAEGSCPRFVDNRATRWLGQRSYGIYIIHYLILTVAYKWAYRPGAWHVTMLRLTVATVPLTIAAADLSWRWIEGPALALRARLGTRGPAPKGAVPAGAAQQSPASSSTPALAVAASSAPVGTANHWRRPDRENPTG